MKVCDMGFLLGVLILDNILIKIVIEFQKNVEESSFS